MSGSSAGIITQGADRYSKLTATIAINTSLSDAVCVKGLNVCGIQMPAAWTAAVLTFQVSMDDGTTFQNYYRDDAELSYSTTMAAAGLSFGFLPTIFDGVTHIKVRSGTASAAVNQAGARSIILGVRWYS